VKLLFRRWAWVLCLAGPAQAGPANGPDGLRPDAVVGANGAGSYPSVQAAIDACPQTTAAARPWTILVRRGTYRELVYVQREKRHLRLVGEGAQATVLTYDLYAGLAGRDGRPIGTFRTPSVQIDADDFTAEDMTFANAAGPKGQALAIRVDGDRAVFRRCRFLGWQDTILENRGRHYYEACDIEGAVDFIFGGATAYFERCRIVCLGNGYITAASTPESETFGFVFRDCEISGANPGVRTFLGRPWRPYAAVAFLNCRMGPVVRPAGWNNWSRPEREQTARFAEAGSTGPGAEPAARAGWARRLSEAASAAITPDSVLAGPDAWRP
jgi:pectinesterase